MPRCTQGRYRRQVSGSRFQFTGRTRRFYIQAEEVVWDYAPQGKNVLYDWPFTETEDVFARTFSACCGASLH